MQFSTAKAGNGIIDSTLSFGVEKGRRFEVPSPYGSARSENVSACTCAGTGRRNLIVCIGVGGLKSIGVEASAVVPEIGRPHLRLRFKVFSVAREQRPSGLLETGLIADHGEIPLQCRGGDGRCSSTGTIRPVGL